MQWQVLLFTKPTSVPSLYSNSTLVCLEKQCVEHCLTKKKKIMCAWNLEKFISLMKEDEVKWSQQENNEEEEKEKLEEEEEKKKKTKKTINKGKIRVCVSLDTLLTEYRVWNVWSCSRHFIIKSVSLRKKVAIPRMAKT